MFERQLLFMSGGSEMKRIHNAFSYHTLCVFFVCEPQII